MSSVERGFIPITEAQSERVRFQVGLPDFVDQDRIGVNLREIQRLCQIGGIHRLVVLGVEDLDTSKTVPQILGFNSQGSTYMGKAASKADVSPSESFSAPGWEGKSHPQQWSDALIAVNMNQVRDRIGNDKRWSEGIRSPKAWSHYLNRGIKDGISKEGIAQLLNLRNKVDLAIFAAFVGAAATDAVPLPRWFDPHIPSVREAIQAYFTWSITWNVIERFMDGKRPFLSDGNNRYTAFYGPEVDRAVLLKVLTKTRTLVKQIEGQATQ
ncbi:hypothetical protein A3G16_03605 [Candidatus Curtissbacteria bacterium RIFCSPLOWO2_12_FULL_41_16]|nr:MAG: hypothetical protein A3G16_03605 [Candidatus Curtissbacteria bacterium RIFCSPLOWO2_12_FULL_41_16]